MKIMVSACLLGQNCKYNGGNNYSEKVDEYVKGHEVISVCPEVAGGLPTPRTPCEIVNGVVMNRNGENKDKEFRAGAYLVQVDMTGDSYQWHRLDVEIWDDEENYGFATIFED
ncbi:Protein of unknown function [Lachnospiraceae bacterium XBB1006]|nr:Protein of unknown function [Lachnospiraceae bacterium XBB1006]